MCPANNKITSCVRDVNTTTGMPFELLQSSPLLNVSAHGIPVYVCLKYIFNSRNIIVTVTAFSEAVMIILPLIGF